MDHPLKTDATNVAVPHDHVVPSLAGVSYDDAAQVSTNTASAPAGASVAPAVRPVRWSGKKTAVAAALAVGLASIGGGAVAAAAPTVNEQLQGGMGGPGGMHGPGGRVGQMPGGPMGQMSGGQMGQVPGPQGQLPAGQTGQVPGQAGQQGSAGTSGSN